MKSFLILMYLLGVTASFLQAQNDWGSSIHGEISWKIFPKIEIRLEEDFRLRDNFSEIDRFSTTLEAGYKPWKFLKAGGAYNLINYKHPSKGWEIRHRYYLFISGSYTFRRFSLSLRERFQHTYRVGIKETAKRANPKQFLRSRIKLAYDIRKSAFEPYGSVELYHPLNDPQDNKMNKLRYTIGSTYKVNKKNLLECFFRYTNFLDDDDVNGKLMIGIGYSYKI